MVLNNYVDVSDHKPVFMVRGKICLIENVISQTELKTLVVGENIGS